MRTIGFVISSKENEKRRAILPYQIRSIQHKNMLYFEEGYGEVLGYSDEDYKESGVNIVSREEVLTKDIICDPKIGDADYLNQLKSGQSIFGWIHAVQNRDITDEITKNKLTAIAWEDMFYKGRHVFWRNNELAGEAAVMQAFTLFGKLPYNCKVAIIGKGNIARGAYKILASLGANIVVYDRKMENLLREEISEYDVVVNGVLWDTSRKDHIIYREDLLEMRESSMIIDISCDEAGGIESSVPTTIENPVYIEKGVLHYVVDHTPAMVSQSVTKTIGDAIEKYIDYIIESDFIEDEVLKNALIIQKGNILDQNIIQYQNRQ